MHLSTFFIFMIEHESRSILNMCNTVQHSYILVSSYQRIIVVKVNWCNQIGCTEITLIVNRIESSEWSIASSSRKTVTRRLKFPESGKRQKSVSQSWWPKRALVQGSVNKRPNYAVSILFLKLFHLNS